MILAAVLGLSDEACTAFLDLSHGEMVAGFENMVGKKLKKKRDVDHIDSPQSKRPEEDDLYVVVSYHCVNKDFMEINAFLKNDIYIPIYNHVSLHTR